MTRHLFCIFIFSFSTCVSQPEESDKKKANFRFENLSINDGLSQSNVRCILQDSQGFLWLGTQDGLNRFDGNNFVVFKNIIGDSNSLSHNYIYALAEDKSGDIWVATGGGGICRYNPSTNSFKRYTKDNRGSNLITILNLYIDSENQIWAGTYLTGLSKYDPEEDSFSSFVYDENNSSSGKISKSIPSNIIVSIYEDRRGNLWLGSADAGLIRFDKNDSTFKSYTERDGLASNYINSICEDNDDNLLIGTMNGLTILDGANNFTSYQYDQNKTHGISSNKIKCMLCDETGNIFIGTEDAGLNYFISHKKIFYKYSNNDKNPYAITDNSIFSIYMDQSGIIWIGTSRGLNKIKNTKKFDVLLGPNSKDPLSGKNIWSVMEDSDKNIWAGTNNGLIKIDVTSNEITTIKKSTSTDNIKNKIIYSLAEDKQRNIWIGTNSGLSCLNKQTNEISTYYYHGTSDSSIYNIIKSIYVEENIVWLGTAGRGIVKFDRTKKIFIPFEPSKSISELLNKYVLFQTYKDNSGDYWFCTTFGLFKYNPLKDELISAISSYDEASKDYTRLYNQSLCLYDDNNYFWIGTSGGGLLKFRPDKGIIKRFTERQGLSNNVVYGILPDSSGNLWLSTNKGISKFNIEKETFKNYYSTDGLPSDEFNSGAYYASSTGKLFFGTINGIVSFYPDEIKNNEYVPSVAVTSFKVFDKPYLDQLFFPPNETIELSYSDNFFSFEFAALDFTNPEKNQYAYLLEGFDGEWNYIGNRRFASYTNIDPGEYIFKVKGSNNDGIWNEQAASIRIIIAPPFYRTWWAYIFYTIIFIGILFSLRQYELNKRKRKEETILKDEREKAKLREAQLRVEKAELQAKAIESEKEIEKQNIRSRIASDLHDEIGSNLSSIGLLSSILMNNGNEDDAKSSINDEAFNKLIDINSAAKISAESIRDIVWFTNPMTDQLSSLVTRMTETTSMMLTNINYRIVTGEKFLDGKINPEIKRNIYLIYKESLNNIIKHSKAKNVEISIKEENRVFILSIEDNGIGFDKEKIKAGNGLRNLSMRSKQINGELEINSILDKGTSIILKVNIKSNDKVSESYS